jgi:hypothetical protein
MDASGGARWSSASGVGWLDSSHPSPRPKLACDPPSPRARPSPSPVELPLLCSLRIWSADGRHCSGARRCGAGLATAPKKRWGPARPRRKKRWGSTAAPKKSWAWRFGAAASCKL